MRHKNFVILFIDILLLVAIIVIYSISSLKSATLTILLVPSDAVAKINNKTFTTGTYSFFPGKITAQIEKDGFDKKEVSMVLEKDANNRLFVYLTKDGELSYLRDKPADFENLKTISNLSDDEKLKSFVEDFTNEQALKNFLPVSYNNSENNRIFNAFYETEQCQEKDYCILLTSLFDGDYDFAIDYLKNFGYSSPEYEIIFASRCKTGDFECAAR